MGKLNTLYRTATGLEKVDIEAIFSELSSATLDEKIHMLGKLIWYIPGGIHSSKYDELKYLLNKTLFGDELLADVNIDKIVNIKDVTLIRQAIANKSTDTKYDVNQDSKITEKDVAIAKMLAVSEAYSPGGEDIVVTVESDPTVMAMLKKIGISETATEVKGKDLASISALPDLSSEADRHSTFVLGIWEADDNISYKNISDPNIKYFNIDEGGDPYTDERTYFTIVYNSTTNDIICYINGEGEGINLNDMTGVCYMEYIYNGETVIHNLTDRTDFETNFITNSWGTVEDANFITYLTGITEIPAYEFEAKIMNSVELPSNITTIGEGAFEECINLSSVTFDSNLTTISDSAFKNCNTLTNLEFNEGLTSIGTSAFENCTTFNISLPSTLTYIGDNAFRTDPGTTSQVESLYIPENVEYIGENAFTYMKNLKELIFADGFTGIISNNAFSQGAVMSYISLGNASYIGDSAFELFISRVEVNTYVTINMSKSVTYIGNNVFRGALQAYTYAITLPETLTHIGNQAFYNLNLLGINYDGSVEDWENIDKANDWYFQGDPVKNYPYITLEYVQCNNGIAYTIYHT